jgi:AraC-like DNA-binding protein
MLGDHLPVALAEPLQELVEPSPSLKTNVTVPDGSVAARAFWQRAASPRRRYWGPMTPVHPVRHLLRAKDLMDARYREPLDVPTLARAAHLSPAHFSREFRRAFGDSPHQYLLTRRLERAAALLRNTDRTIVDICLLVGLRSVGSFATSFGRAFGVTPTAYRAARTPAVARARVPTCVLQAYARPQSSTFGEDSRAGPG